MTGVSVSRHACVRYQERVKPALDLDQARVDLERALALATRQRDAPGWVASGVEAHEWLVLGDGIAFPVVFGCVATCLTRSETGEQLRERRNDRRQDRSRRRNARGARTEHGKVARDARRRRRAAKDGSDA